MKLNKFNEAYKDFLEQEILEAKLQVKPRPPPPAPTTGAPLSAFSGTGASPVSGTGTPSPAAATPPTATTTPTPPSAFKTTYDKIKAFYGKGKTAFGKTLNRPSSVLRGIASVGGYDIYARDEPNITPTQIDTVGNLLNTKGTVNKNFRVYNLDVDVNVNEFINALKQDDPDAAYEFEEKFDDLRNGRVTKPIFINDPAGGHNIAIRKRGNNYEAFIKI